MDPELLFSFHPETPDEKLLVALFAARGAFLAIGVATLAILVGPILAKAFDLAGGFFMALLAVADSGDMSLVVELDSPFQLDDLRSGKGGARKRDQGKQCNNGVFHFSLHEKMVINGAKLLHAKKGCQAKYPHGLCAA